MGYWRSIVHVKKLKNRKRDISVTHPSFNCSPTCLKNLYSPIDFHLFFVYGCMAQNGVGGENGSCSLTMSGNDPRRSCFLQLLKKHIKEYYLEALWQEW